MVVFTHPIDLSTSDFACAIMGFGGLKGDASVADALNGNCHSMDEECSLMTNASIRLIVRVGCTFGNYCFACVMFAVVFD